MNYLDQERKSDLPSLEQFNVIPIYVDGLPELVNMWKFEQLIIGKFGSIETYKKEYSKNYAREFIRCIDNYYSRWRSECSPVYVFESLDGYHYANDTFRGERLCKPSFVLDDGILLEGLNQNRELIEPLSLWMPCGYEPSPVIIVYDDRNSKQVSELIGYLKESKINYFCQSIDDMRDLVRSWSIEDVKNELKAQRSKDYEYNDYERTLALWMM